MANQLSPKQAAARLAKWAKAGFDIAMVDGLISSLQQDKTDSAGRAPRRSGRLAATVRVIKPSATTAANKGFIIGRLGAGSRKRKEAGGVPYARVLQVGGVFVSPGSNATHTNRHEIRARKASWSDSGKLSESKLKFVIGGRVVFARRVNHPGSRFKATNYLRIDETRLKARVDGALQHSADKEIG